MVPELIETLLVTAERDIPLLGRHLTRLTASARALEYHCDPATIEREVLATACALQGEQPHRLRLLLQRSGQISLQAEPLAPLPERLEILLAPEVLDHSEPLLRYKTTHRPWYAKTTSWLPAHPQIFDMVFVNDKGELCEGSRSNLYLKLRGHWYTPPVACGLLPGVQRAELLENGLAQERVLTLEDLHDAEGIRLSNALRGWIDVTLHDN